MARSGITFPFRAHIGKPIVFPLIQGTAAITEADDTLGSTGTLIIQGVLAVTEAGDTLGATGTLLIQGAAAITEAGDTLGATGTVIIQGTAAITEADDTLAAAGGSGITGTASITEADDSIVATGTITQPVPPVPDTGHVPQGIVAAFVEEYGRPKRRKKKKLKIQPEVITEVTILNDPEKVAEQVAAWSREQEERDAEDIAAIMELLNSLDD